MSRQRSFAGPLGCGALLALAACFPQFGEYDGNGAATGGGGDQSGGSGGAPPPETCGVDGFCVDVPTGWEGPVALSEPGGICFGAYAGTAATGETNVSASPTSCKCECGAASGSTCPAATVTRFLAAGCGTALDTINVPSPGCTAISAANASSWRATAAAAGGSCLPTDLQETLPAVFEERAVCSASAPPSCEGGLGCAPHPGEGFEPRICIMEQGDVDCTSPSFAVKTLVFTAGHADTRACDAACTCVPPTAVCGGVVTGRQGTACGSAQDGVTVNSCSDSYVDSNQSLTYTPTLTSEGSCKEAPRVSIGAVTGLAPITLCCSGVL